MLVLAMIFLGGIVCYMNKILLEPILQQSWWKITILETKLNSSSRRPTPQKFSIDTKKWQYFGLSPLPVTVANEGL